MVSMFVLSKMACNIHALDLERNQVKAEKKIMMNMGEQLICHIFVGK